jgi:hypothetical protein
LFTCAAICPDRSLAQEHIADDRRRTVPTRCRIFADNRSSFAREMETDFASAAETAAAGHPAPSGKPFELVLGKLTYSEHGRSLNNGKHLIEYVLRLQLAVQYSFKIKH